MIVVVGGGISGLAIAWELRRRGAEALVLETSERAGGKIRTTIEEGLRLEHGPGALDLGEPALRALVDDLGLADLVVTSSGAVLTRCVLHRGRAVPVPRSLRELASTPLLSAGARLRALAGLALAREASPGESVGAYARRRLGREAAERLLYPLVSSLYASDPERTSVVDAFPRLARVDRGLLAGRPLSTFPAGVEELTRALAARLEGALELGVSLAGVERRGGRFRLSVLDRGRRDEMSADVVVLALPAHAAGRALVALDERLAQTVSDIPYAPVTLVHVVYERAALPPAYGFFVPPGETSRLAGAIFTSAIFPDAAPAGRSLVCARVGGARAPSAAALEDAPLVEMVRSELAPIVGAEPSRHRIVRHECALPQYTLDHARKLATIAASESANPGLLLAGNAYRGLGVADCVRAAGPLAERALALLAACASPRAKRAVTAW